MEPLTEVTIGAVMDRVVGGGTPSREVGSYWGGNISWATVKDLADDQFEIRSTMETITPEGLAGSAANLIPSGTVVVCTRMAVGRSAITARPMAINQDLKALIPNGSIDPRFLLHQLKRSQPHLDGLGIGSTVRGITVGQLTATKILLPSLSEQRAIAEILDTADEAIRLTERAIAKLEEVQKGLLHDLLTRGVDENGELRDPERNPEQFKDSPVGRIPVGWCCVRVGEAFDMQLGKMLHQGARKGGRQFPYLANRHVQWGRIDLDGLESMAFSRAEQERFRLLPGDILICEGGEVGRAAIWPYEDRQVYFQKALHRLRTSSGLVRPAFMLGVMQFGARHGWFGDLTSSTSIAHLTQEKLATFLVPCPPAAEQSLICEHLEEIERRVATEALSLEKLRSLKTGLANDLLTGRVRVPIPEEAAA